MKLSTKSLSVCFHEINFHSQVCGPIARKFEFLLNIAQTSGGYISAGHFIGIVFPRPTSLLFYFIFTPLSCFDWL